MVWFRFSISNSFSIYRDATSCLTSLVFFEGETTEGYFHALKQHIDKYGIPRSLYTDKDSVFKPSKGIGTTQFQRALKELDIELILANSPQAKGRVERANRTLQDHLVKEFRLRGITTIEQANEFAKTYVNEYNNKFSKKPRSTVDAHRPLDGYDVQLALTHRETRTILSGCIFQYNKNHYVVQNNSSFGCLKGMKIDIYENLQREKRFFIKGKEVEVILWDTCEVPQELTRKEVLVKESRQWKHSRLHPWKRFRRIKKGYSESQVEEMEIVV